MQLQQCKQFSVLEPVKIKSDEMISEKIKLSINFWNLFWTFEIIHETLIIWIADNLGWYSSGVVSNVASQQEGYWFETAG